MEEVLTEKDALAEVPKDDKDMCLAEYKGYGCTRPRGHLGPHIACSDIAECIRWVTATTTEDN